MKQMVMLVMTNPDHCMTLLEAWEAAGAPGITILESTGLNTMRHGGTRDDLPLMPSLSSFFRTQEVAHRTIFSVVDSEEHAQTLIKVTEEVFDRYEIEDRDNSGVVFVLPVSETHSYSTSRAKAKMEKWKQRGQ
jgi:nitrogen regulatory protein PII